MTSLYALKPQLQDMVRPIARRLHASGLTANMVTIATTVGSAAIGVTMTVNAIDRDVFLVLPAWLAVRLVLNLTDGILARELGQQSRLGAYLNELCDPIAEIFLYAPFALIWPFDSSDLMPVLALMVLAEFSGVLGQSFGATRRHDGPMSRLDRGAVFAALAVWIGTTDRLPDWLGWGPELLAALLALTIVNRVRAGLAESTDHPLHRS